MTDYAGSAFLLKTGTWSGGTTVAGCTANTLTINNEIIDTSSKDSNWFTGIAGGIKSVEISGSGKVTDAASFETFHGYATEVPAGAHALAMGWADGDTAEGPFIITSCTLNGPLKEAQTFDFTARAVGAVTFTST